MSLVVVYDHGSAAPVEIINSLASRKPLIVLGESDHARSVRPLVEPSAGAVVDLVGPVASAAGQLRPLAPTGIVTFSERMLRATADLAADGVLSGAEIGRKSYATRSTGRADRRCPSG